MPTDLTLRPAAADDAEALARIHLAARASAPMPPVRHTQAEVVDWLAERLATDETWVAESDGAVAAYIRLSGSWLDDLYVAPHHAGQGIGSTLLELAMARRPEGLCLWAFEMNAPARAFYSRRGFVELERTDGRDNEESQPDVRMAWPGTDPLSFYRSLIDELDIELGDLLNRRVALTKAVQPHKTSTERDPARERRIAEMLAERAPELGVERLEEIVHTIITQSLDVAARFARP